MGKIKHTEKFQNQSWIQLFFIWNSDIQIKFWLELLYNSALIFKILTGDDEEHQMNVKKKVLKYRCYLVFLSFSSLNFADNSEIIQEFNSDPSKNS